MLNKGLSSEHCLSMKYCVESVKASQINIWVNWAKILLSYLSRYKSRYKSLLAHFTKELPNGRIKVKINFQVGKIKIRIWKSNHNQPEIVSLWTDTIGNYDSFRYAFSS